MLEKPQIAEVWRVDLGMTGKVRPVLVLTSCPSDQELDLYTVLAHTTSLRNNPWELKIQKPFLKEGAFHLQQIQTLSRSVFLKKLGQLNEMEFSLVRQKLKLRLNL
ncbi:MAG: type II toxin-antitoxin system PemK/MazF family toxin [Verrucomicrobiia bacterium]